MRTVRDKLIATLAALAGVTTPIQAQPPKCPPQDERCMCELARLANTIEAYEEVLRWFPGNVICRDALRQFEIGTVRAVPQSHGHIPY